MIWNNHFHIINNTPPKTGTESLFCAFWSAKCQINVNTELCVAAKISYKMTGTDNGQVLPRDIFLKFVEENLNCIIWYFYESAIDEETLDYLSYHLEQLTLVVSQGLVVGYLDNHVVDLLQLVLKNVEKIFANDERHDSKLLMISTGNIGRPKFDVTREMLITFLETRF